MNNPLSFQLNRYFNDYHVRISKGKGIENLFQPNSSEIFYFDEPAFTKYQNYISIMRNNGTLYFYLFSFFYLFPLFKEKAVLLLSVYTLFMGNNIDIVVVQQDTMHNKTLPQSSHILCTYHLFYYFRNWIYALSTHFISYHMIQVLTVGFTTPF